VGVGGRFRGLNLLGCGGGRRDRRGRGRIRRGRDAVGAGVRGAAGFSGEQFGAAQPELISQVAGELVVGVALQDFVERDDGAVDVALGSVDAREGHGRYRRGGFGRRAELGVASDQGGGVGQVEAALDHAREQAARNAHPGDGVGVGGGWLGPTRLVDGGAQLGPRHHVGVRHAEALRQLEQFEAGGGGRVGDEFGHGFGTAHARGATQGP
jgi:hypothetical protein